MESARKNKKYTEKLQKERYIKERAPEIKPKALVSISSLKFYPGSSDGYANHRLIPDGKQEPAHFPVLQQ